MHRKFGGVWLLATACGPSLTNVEVPSTEVTLEQPLAPSALALLGIRETVGGSYAGAERATRSVTTSVAYCVRPTLEREPWLTGALRFQWEVTRPETLQTSGELASLSVASCVKAELAKAALAPGASGSIDYTLQFGGGFTATPIADEHELNSTVIAINWAEGSAKPPEQVRSDLAGTSEKLRRCAFGASPQLEQPLWLVLGVAANGTVTLGPPDDANEPSEASACIRRTLVATRFPSEGRGYGLSVELSPTEPMLQEANSETQQEFGMIGLLNTGAGGDPDAPTAPWGPDADPLSAKGNVWGDSVGGAYTAGALGLAGIGEGGGGRGEGIGLGSIGSIGHGAGTGTGQGFGTGSGRLGSSRANPPKVRMGETSVNGRLPREVIQRIVRQNFGRFRLCYENGLRNDPKLGGKVSVSFKITKLGEVAEVSHTSDLKDKSVGSCVAKAFNGLSFPQPEGGGVVRVTYPIKFSPGDAAPAQPAAPPPPKTLAGKPIAAISMADLQTRFAAKQLQFVPVPGSDGSAGFVRQGLSVFALSLGKRPASTNSFESCIEVDGERALFVGGPGCRSLLQTLLD